MELNNGLCYPLGFELRKLEVSEEMRNKPMASLRLPRDSTDTRLPTGARSSHNPWTPMLTSYIPFLHRKSISWYNASTTCTIPSKPLNNAVLSVHMGTDILRSRAAQLKCFSSVIGRIITKVHKVCTKVTVLWDCTKTRGSISCQSSLYVALKAELRYCSGNNKTILYELGFYNT